MPTIASVFNMEGVSNSDCRTFAMGLPDLNLLNQILLITEIVSFSSTAYARFATLANLPSYVA